VETNRDRDRLFVRFADRNGCDAAIVAADPRCDLAVLRLETEGTRALTNVGERGETIDWRLPSPPRVSATDLINKYKFDLVTRKARRPLRMRPQPYRPDQPPLS
jgi:hypothetical protein